MAIRENRRIAPFLGIAAVLAGLAMAELVASLKNDFSSPVVSLGNRVIDHVPAPVKEFAIRTFGFYDKIALIISILIVVLVLAVVIGRAFISGNRKAAFGIVIALTAIAAN